jgi:hypothetical protein
LTGANYDGRLEYRIAISTGLAETSLLVDDGDLITKENGVSARLPIGTSGQVLSVSESGLLTYSNRPNPNHIINGNFDFWQRGTSLPSGTGNRKIADRFAEACVTSTCAVSRQTLTQPSSNLFNAAYFHRASIASGNTSSSIAVTQHNIEDVTRLAGKTVTISFWAKADSNKNISLEMEQGFGTGGSPSTSVLGIGVRKISIGTSWQKITHTVTLPFINGKTLGTDGVQTTRTTLNIWYDAGSNNNSRTDSLGNQSGTFDIAQVKLEEGDTATPFVLAGGTIEGELAACQRYYEKSYVLSNTYFAQYGLSPNTFYGQFMEFKQEKRVSPTLTYVYEFGTKYWVIVGTSPVSAESDTGRSLYSNVSGWSIQHTRQAGNGTPASGNIYVWEPRFSITADAEF